MASETKDKCPYEWKLMFRYYFMRTGMWITFNWLRILICYINWWAENYHISPRHVNSPEWLVLGWKYLPKSLYTHFWWVGEWWFPTLLFIHLVMIIAFEIFYKIVPIFIFEKTLAVLIIIYLVFFHFFTLS